MSGYRFNNDYQDLALATLIRHQDKLAHVIPCLKATYFGGVEATLAAREALAYYESAGRLPTFPVLEQLVADSDRKLDTESSDTESVGAYVHRLSEVDTADWEHVANTVVEFAREQALLGAVRKCIDLLKEGKEPPGGYGQMFDEARAVGQNLNDLGLILHQDGAATVDKVTSEEYGISTGYNLLDQIWKMGWKPGWLVVPLAPPKHYKSTFCINLALNMVSPALGYDVIYYACEISQELSVMRALCNLGHVDMDVAFESPEGFKEHVQKAVDENVAGHLLFKSFASKSATINDLRAHTRTAIKQLGIKPRMIVIDYAETVMPAARGERESDYRLQANIYTDARAMAQEFGVVVVMPDRCNRETVGQKVPNMHSFQGAFEKAGIVDVAIGLCATEEEYITNVLRLFVFLNRHGPAFQQIRGRVKPEHYRIELEAQVDYHPDEEEDSGKKFKGRKGGVKVPDELADRI